MQQPNEILYGQVRLRTTHYLKQLREMIDEAAFLFTHPDTLRGIVEIELRARGDADWDEPPETQKDASQDALEGDPRGEAGYSVVEEIEAPSSASQEPYSKPSSNDAGLRECDQCLMPYSPRTKTQRYCSTACNYRAKDERRRGTYRRKDVVPEPRPLPEWLKSCGNCKHGVALGAASVCGKSFGFSCKPGLTWAKWERK